MSDDTVNVWKEYDAPAGRQLHWRIGPLELWAERDDREWRCVSDTAEDEFLLDLEDQAKPDDKEWSRWSYSSPCKSVKLEPVLPDRPLIVRPLAPIQILPDQESRYFVSVPLWVRMKLVNGSKSVVLNDWPTLTLSNSWSGTPVDGELCYALKTRARVSLEEIQPKPWRAIFPLTIRNAHDEPLKFERLCLHGEYLNVYRGNSHLWTSEGEFVYKGPMQYSQVSFGKGAPPFDDAKTVVGAARQEPRNFASLSFDNLKSFALG